MLEAFLDDAPQVAVRQFQHCSATHVEREFFQLCEARPGELVRQGPGSKSEVATQTCRKPLQESGCLGAAGGIEFGTDLEASPCGAVEEFAVVGRPDEDHMCGEPVDLEQQGGDDALDFAGLVLIRPLLGDGVEFIEEQNAPARSGELERIVEPGGGLAQEAGYHALVADDVERQHQLGGDGFRNAGLAVSRGPGQQKSVAGLDPVTAQQLGSLLFLDQLGRDPTRYRREFEVVQPTVRDNLLHEVTDRCGPVVTDKALPRGRDKFGKPISEKVVLVGAFFGNHGLDQDAEAVPVTATLGFHEVEKQVGSRHRPASLAVCGQVFLAYRRVVRRLSSRADTLSRARLTGIAARRSRGDIWQGDRPPLRLLAASSAARSPTLSVSARRLAGHQRPLVFRSPKRQTPTNVTTGKKIDKSAHIGDAGIALIHTRVSAMGHVWHPRGLDAGIDGSIELRDSATGEVTNRHLQVQSKASDRSFAGETPSKFHYIVDERDLKYWMQANTPVILICSHPKSSEAWWVHVQGYFDDPARRADRRVDFTKATMAFDDDISDRLFAVADPHGQAHTPVAEQRQETLVSNLLPVEIPDQYWSYPSNLKNSGHVYRVQRESGKPYRHDFVLKGGRLLTWRPADNTGLAEAVSGDGCVVPTGELLDGSEDGERQLVWMLNAALRQDLVSDCLFHIKRQMLYFKATRDRQPRRVPTGGKRPRAVFKGHPKKTDPAQVAYYKHSGLRWQFIEADGQWYCALTPDYFYSYDGKRESKYTASYLSGIKKLERNASVLGETRMWANFLRFEPTLLDDDDRILDFGHLEEFKVERGLSDADWRKDDMSSSAESDWSLFEETA